MGVCHNLWNPIHRGDAHPCIPVILVWTAGYHDFRPMAILMAISKFEKPAHNLQDQMCWVVLGWTVSVFSLDHLMITWKIYDLRGLAMARWKKSGARKMSAIAQFFGGGSHTFAVQAKKKRKSRSFSVVSTIRSYCGTVGLSIKANVLFWGSWRNERITKWC